MRAVADGRLVLLRLDVDDDVASGQSGAERILHAVCSCMTLPNGRTRRNGDDHVHELAWPCLPHAESLERHRRLDSRDRHTGRLLCVCRCAIHQDIHVALHQPSGGEQDEPSDEERGHGVRSLVTFVHEHEPDQHCDGAGEITGKVERVRRQRCASIAA